MSKYRGLWFKVNSKLLDDMRLEVASKYPNLHFRIENNAVLLSGSFPIEHEGICFDRFLIEIEFPNNYPKGLPVVREIGGRIPWTSDRHIFETGIACLFFPYQLASLYPKGTTILEYLDGPVISFFISQSIFEKTGKWPFGQWSHDVRGEDEFFASVLGFENRLVIARFKVLIKGKTVKGHWLCPCGSGEKLRNCHFEVVKKLQNDFLYAREQYPWNKIVRPSSAAPR